MPWLLVIPMTAGNQIFNSVSNFSSIAFLLPINFGIPFVIYILAMRRKAYLKVPECANPFFLLTRVFAELLVRARSVLARRRIVTAGAVAFTVFLQRFRVGGYVGCCHVAGKGNTWECRVRSSYPLTCAFFLSGATVAAPPRARAGRTRAGGQDGRCDPDMVGSQSGLGPSLLRVLRAMEGHTPCEPHAALLAGIVSCLLPSFRSRRDSPIQLRSESPFWPSCCLVALCAGSVCTQLRHSPLVSRSPTLGADFVDPPAPEHHALPVDWPIRFKQALGLIFALTSAVLLVGALGLAVWLQIDPLPSICDGSGNGTAAAVFEYVDL